MEEEPTMPKGLGK
jgi:hypothetical protein